VSVTFPLRGSTDLHIHEMTSLWPTDVSRSHDFVEDAFGDASKFVFVLPWTEVIVVLNELVSVCTTFDKLDGNPPHGAGRQ